MRSTRHSAFTDLIGRWAHERGASRIAVDGVDGVGKSTFATALSASLDRFGSVTLIHADDHLNPPQVRHARGRTSPEGFWLDSYDYSSLRDAIRSTTGRVVAEGLFLHRDELVDLWDFSIYLHAPFSTSVTRLAARDGSHPDPDHASLTRYVEGQCIYFSAARPWARATVVVDYTHLDRPTIVDARAIEKMPDLPS